MLGAAASVPKCVWQVTTAWPYPRLVFCTGSNSKAAEAAGSAYYNPNNPHNVYMPMVSCFVSFPLNFLLSLISLKSSFRQFPEECCQLNVFKHLVLIHFLK